MSQVAKLNVVIDIDKNSDSIEKQVAESLKKAKKIADGTEIDIKYKGDPSKAEDALKEVRKQLEDLDKNLRLNIDIGNIKDSVDDLKVFKENIEQIFKELSKGSKLSFGGFDAGDLTAEIKQVEKELEKAQKKLVELNKTKTTSGAEKSLKEYITEIKTLEKSLDSLDEKSYDKAGKNLLTLVEEFKRAGGSVSELGDRVQGTLKELTDFGLKPNKIKIVDEKAIKEQEQLVANLQKKLTELKDKVSSTTSGQTSLASDTNSKEIEKLNAELEEQKQKTIAVNEQLEEQRKLYSELENKNAELQQQLKNSVGTEAYKELEKTLAQVTAQMEEAKLKATDLENQLAGSFSYTNRLADKIIELEKGEVVPKSDYDTASSVVSSQEKRIDKQREKISKLEDETIELAQANEKLSETNSKLIAENVTLSDRIEEQKNALDTVNQQIKENEATIESYRSAIETTSNALSECQEKLKQFSFDPFEQSLKQMGQFNDTKDMTHFDKAASYYGIYQEQGGQERAIINEIDITDKLIARYKELQIAHSMATPEIIAKLNAINKETFALNEQRDAIEKNIKALEKEEKAEKAVAKAAEKASASKKTKVKTSSSVDDENKAKRANSLLARIEAARKAQDSQTVSTEKSTQAQKEQTKAVEQTGQALKENQDIANISVSSDKLSQSFEEERQIVERVVAAEKESLNELSQKITEVIADVNRKTQAFKEEAQVVDGTVQSEINALATLSGRLLSLKDDVEKLSASISSIEPVDIKINSNLDEAFRNVDSIAIGKKLEGLNELDRLKNIRPGDLEKKLTRIGTALNEFSKSIKQLKIDDLNMLSSIEKILEKGKELENLASVLKSSKKAIEEAGKATNANYVTILNLSDGEVAPLLDKWNQKWSEQIGTIEKVEKSVRKVNNELKESYKLTGSTGKTVTVGKNGDIVNAKGTLYDVKQLEKERTTQANALLKEQEMTLERIGQLRAEIIKQTSAGNVNQANEAQNSLKAEKEHYSILVAETRQYDDIISNSQRRVQLAQAAAQAEEKVRNATAVAADKANKQSNNDAVKSAEQATKRNKELAAIYDKAYQSAEKYYTLKNKLDSTSPNKQSQKDKDTFAEVKEAIDKATNSLKEYQDIMSKSLGSEASRNALAQSFNNFNTNSINKYLDSLREVAASAQSSLDKFGINKRGLEYIDALNAKVEELKGKIRLVENMDFSSIGANGVPGVEKLKTEILELEDAIKAGKNNLTFVAADVKEVYDQIAKINEILRKNTKMNESAKGRELIQQFKDLESKFKLVIDTGKSQADVKNLRGELSRLNAELQRSGKTGNSVFTTLAAKIKGLSLNFVAMYFSFYDWIRYIRYAGTTIKNFNTALTEMRKVSEETVTTLRSFQNESFGMADSVGTTGLQIQQSTADFMRLGESIDQAKESAVEANKLLNVSEFEGIDAATESLVSMSQAYKELGKGEIIDVLNELGNNYAISTDGLATALKDSASALRTANNDFNEAAALTTAANTVVQDPSKVGAGKLMPEHIVICGY